MNEDRALIRNTVASLQALRGEKEIYLLDDARKPACAQLAVDMNVRYITRTGNELFKAGNLNNAMREDTEEVVIVADADFALRPEFIERAIPVFNGPSIAAVQSPQM